MTRSRDNVPSGWAQKFQNPRCGYSSISGYGPESFQIRDNKASIRNVRDDIDLIQRIVNNAKQYIIAANSAHIEQLREQAKEKERRQRAEIEKKVADAESKKNILSKVKL